MTADGEKECALFCNSGQTNNSSVTPNKVQSLSPLVFEIVHGNLRPNTFFQRNSGEAELLPHYQYPGKHEFYSRNPSAKISININEQRT